MLLHQAQKSQNPFRLRCSFDSYRKPLLTFRFCSQNFLLSLPACCSNCEAPCCRASARSSSSDSFWSLSSTFSTFVFMMSTTCLPSWIVKKLKCIPSGTLGLTSPHLLVPASAGVASVPRSAGASGVHRRFRPLPAHRPLPVRVHLELTWWSLKKERKSKSKKRMQKEKREISDCLQGFVL